MKQINCKPGSISIRKITVYIVFSLFVLGAIAGCQTTSQGKPAKILECELLGGTIVDQPAGSGITACCYDNGCWICDEKGDDCVFDPAYSAPFWEEVFK
jgi:hypothetical protein